MWHWGEKMIVYKSNKCYETRSDKANENWTGNKDVFVVEDGTKLANKILKYAPYYNFVVDDKGLLIDITPVEIPPAADQETKPSETQMLMDFIVDVDYRVSVLELGMQTQQT